MYVPARTVLHTLFFNVKQCKNFHLYIKQKIRNWIRTIHFSATVKIVISSRPFLPTIVFKYIKASVTGQTLLFVPA